jgi:hypothetical protein
MTTKALLRRVALVVVLAVTPGLLPPTHFVLRWTGREAALLAAEQAQELFQRALTEENARGDLNAAVALFEQAATQAARSDRALAARALIHVANIREKLGQPTPAANTYAEVIRLYPEQRSEVTVAQWRLSVLRPRDAAAPLPQPRTPAVGAASSATTPLVERYCTNCHNASSRSGDLDLATLNSRRVGENTAMWEKVLGRLRARRDPPPGAPRPDEATYRSVIVKLERALDSAYAATRTVNSAERASDGELATRIAALIWNGPPDAALLDDAQRGRLHDRVVLNRQIVRMLRDPKSAGLVDGFFTDWLWLDKLNAARPDAARYPQVDTELLQSMSTETRLFLHSQVRDDRDAVELWTANYSYVNERLARHYGLTDIAGREFRRVTWPNGSRAGILGQAGPLTVLSFPERTSPTTRGRFVLSRFLGVDAPVPPSNVPPLAERPPTPGTMRDRMQAHKVNPSCASCHSIFDPLGLAFENFDATGGWRTTDGGTPIDASGAFFDGTRFDGPAEFRAGLLKYRDAYYSSLTRQLLAYALRRNGRAGRVYDYEMPAVRTIVRDASANGFRWSAILTGICASAPFQMKQIVP